jgi:hypothetical protein
MRRARNLMAQSRLAFLSMLFVVGAAMAFASSGADAALSAPVKAPNFNGTFNLVGFTTPTVNGVPPLAAIGSFAGTLSAPNGTLQSERRSRRPRLQLDLGPLHLDLLGLKVDLSRILLDITAQGGAGNLLGNLLCAVAAPLDPSQLSTLASRLNDILALR